MVDVSQGLAGRFLSGGSDQDDGRLGGCEPIDPVDGAFTISSIERMPVDDDDANALVADRSAVVDVPVVDGVFALETDVGVKLVCEPGTHVCVGATVVADEVTTVNVLIGQSTVFTVIEGESGDVARGPVFFDY
jgi:hypothetical protein